MKVGEASRERYWKLASERKETLATNNNKLPQTSHTSPRVKLVMYRLRAVAAFKHDLFY